MSNEISIPALKDPETREREFTRLVTAYQERLYWHIRRIVLNHDDTDDVLQNTFIKVYRNLENFRGESAIYSWMYRIASNEALNFLKKRAREKKISDEEYKTQLANSLVADVYFEGDQIQLKLQQALATLPEKQQLVFNMKYFEDMKYDDISEVLNTSVGALKASYHHAMKKIEAHLKNTP
ncbi:RNA polymerase sigma factor [Robertkochia sediminum]|uniref:RNA polymerase sigma factor n=1 Tax=Robertkochia sediminum TaxID=2785326 RepID=UPI001933C3F2|nr:RNA polymerase sigma factor [Robertkochia sediminum]MBL7473120.1 RNA polymerase sigma factor [Robertkochia sediminum]